MSPKATQYANSKVPNPDRNDAPYFTSRDRWQDVYEAYEAGEKGLREQSKKELESERSKYNKILLGMGMEIDDLRREIKQLKDDAKPDPWDDLGKHGNTGY